MSTNSAALVGSTGLVGSQILLALASNPAYSSIHAISRRSLPSYDKLKPIIEADNSKWTSAYSSISPAPTIFFSGLGTTRAQAGSFEKQVLIDRDLNLALAKEAKAAGTKIYVLISGGSANSSSMFGYLKMKGELEDGVRELGFEHCVILRPGLLLGSRQDSRPSERAFQMVANGMGALTKKAVDFWAQDVAEVGRAAVAAGQMCLEGKREPGVWIVDQAAIVKMGRV